MARTPLSDDACDRLVASRDPVDVARLRDGAVADVSLRLCDELLLELAGQQRSRRRPARRRRDFGFPAGRRRVAAVAAVLAAGVLAIVASLPAGSGHGGPLDVPSASAALVLDGAAQSAMRSARVAPGQGQYGFLEVETGSVVGTGSLIGLGRPSWSVWVRTSEVKSDWYSADGSGRERVVRTSLSFLTPRDRQIAEAHGMSLARAAATLPRIDDGAFPARTLKTAGLLPYWQMNRLPTGPATLRRALEGLLAGSAGSATRAAAVRRQILADPAGLFAPISQLLLLPTSPRLRAALFQVLAELPGIQLLGHQRDRLGRAGIAVAVTHGWPNLVREELLFDPATSNVLETEVIELRAGSSPALGTAAAPEVPAGTVVTYTDFISRGVVPSITQLPGGRRQPLRSADGSR